MGNKKTVVLGATPNPSRYAYIAMHRLTNAGIEAVPVGFREGQIAGVDILLGQPALEDVHTVTLYLNPQRQQPYYDYILSLNPARIIFNPGTENPELMRLARERGIDTETGCTLVMVAMDNY